MAVTDPKTGEIRYQNMKSGGTSTGAVNEAIAQCRATGQCGQGANDYLEKLGFGRLMKNTYNEKRQYVQSKTPAVGELAIWQPTGHGAQPQYGHVGIVTEVNSDGTVTIHDWNWNGDGKQQTHKVAINAITRNGGGFTNLLGTQEKTGNT